MNSLWTPDETTWARMFKATARKRAFAEKLLAQMTMAELRLWAELSRFNCATKSRPCCPWKPQVVIKGWIVDFYNERSLVAVEVDGPVHNEAEQRTKDAIKDAALYHFGIRVRRFTNAEVFRDPAAIARRLDINE